MAIIMVFSVVGFAIGATYAVFRRKILIGGAGLSIYKGIENWEYCSAHAMSCVEVIMADMNVQTGVVMALVGLGATHAIKKINLVQLIKEAW